MHEAAQAEEFTAVIFASFHLGKEERIKGKGRSPRYGEKKKERRDVTLLPPQCPKISFEDLRAFNARSEHLQNHRCGSVRIKKAIQPIEQGIHVIG